MSSIGREFMYICSYTARGKWEVRKVNKDSSETEATHIIDKSKCDCKGFEHGDKCKHLQMITGKFTKGKGMKKVGDKSAEVIKFLKEYVNDQFKCRHHVNFLDESGEMAERFDILCEADERKVLWTQLLTPVETSTSKGVPVLIRLIFTTSYDEDVESF